MTATKVAGVAYISALKGLSFTLTQLFYKAGLVTLRQLSSQAVLLILEKRGKEAGVSEFSPHDFRRTFISDLLDSGVDIVTVQKLVGHATTDQTARYDRRGEETKRQAVQFLSIPKRR